MSTTDSMQVSFSLKLAVSASRAPQSAMVDQMEHIILHQRQGGPEVTE